MSSCCLNEHICIFLLDVKTTFWYGDIYEKIYVTQPQGLVAETRISSLLAN